jgi:glycosyltransferase involved in cell wall biosynthesis
MRIALFHNLPPGGAKRAVYEEVKFLTNNHEIDAYTYSCTDESFLNIENIVNEYIRFEYKPDSGMPGFLNRLASDYNTLFKLRHTAYKQADMINKDNYDVCLVHPDKFTQAPFLLRYLKIPSLYFCEEYLRIVYEKQFEFEKVNNPLKNYYEKYTREIRKSIDKNNAISASLVVANSRFTKNNIETAYGINAQFVHLGVDPDVFRHKNRNKDKEKYIIFVGDENDRLGYGMVKDISDILKREYKINVKSLGFSKGSEFIDNDEDMSRQYSNALATICTHKNEPFGIPPLESMACETPVLAVNEGGYRETVIDGVSGYLLPRSVDKFVEKLEFLINNPKVVKKMGKQAREYVKSKFTWEMHSKSIEKYLKKLVDGYEFNS